MRIALKVVAPLMLATILSLATVAVMAPSVSALTGEEQSSETEQKKHEQAEKEAARQKAKEEAATKLREKGAERKEAVKTKLEDAKLRVCQKREATINSIMKRIGSRGQAHLDQITRIAEQAQKFYTDHDKVVTNYDALIADIIAKKVAAQTAVDAAKTTSASFKCDGTDPKGAAASFKEKQRVQAEALKAYKTSVKALIAAIRTAHKTTEGGQQ